MTLDEKITEELKGREVTREELMEYDFEYLFNWNDYQVYMKDDEFHLFSDFYNDGFIVYSNLNKEFNREI